MAVRKIIKIFVIEAICLYLTTLVTTGLVFTYGIRSLLLTAVALALANTLIKPVINVLLLPINLITFNLFRFLSVSITLFLVDLILPEFSVKSFYFTGLPWDPELLPHISFPAGILAYVGFSFILTSISSFAFWLLK